MNEKIINLTTKIQKQLEKKKKALKIDELLLKVESNEEVKLINSEIDQKIKKIEELQIFLSMESKEIKSLIKEISDLKIKLYEIKDVKKYNKALAKYNEYIDYINKEIFGL